MCGVFGYIGNITRTHAAKCLDLLEHRGPDGSGIWQGAGITLGHRRLSILDVSENGTQPMSFADERYWITFNGEVYNFVELRKELEQHGYSFKSDTDTEVILGAYVKWGAECLSRFNGMWSLAIWDSVDRTLFLSRDRFGKKPLFIARLGNDLAFASEMKAIFPLLPNVQESEHFNWIVNHQLNYEATNKCLIKGIERFPAAHYGIYKDGHLTLTRYWNTLDHLVDVPGDYAEQVEQYRELFVDACRIRMRSDVPIGCALSGGLDSSAIVSVMAHVGNSWEHNRISEDWQHAFVASFPGTPLDEAYYARKAAEHAGVNATFVDIDPQNSIDKLEDYFFKFEELYPACPIPMMQIYSSMKQHGVSVTLDGHGADELLAGYPNLLFEFCIGNGYGVDELSNLYRDLMPKETSQFKVSGNNLILYSYFALRKYIKQILGVTHKTPDSQHPGFSKLNKFNQYLYALAHQTILPTLLRNYDRYSMANSVEIRMPFMDHRIVSYSLSLPMRSKLDGGYTKKIVRDAIGRYMPEEVAFRKSKIGFNSPIFDWMQNQMRAYLLDTIRSKDFLECSLIEAKQVRTQIENVINGKKADFRYAQAAWSAFSPYLWKKAMLSRQY